MVDLPEPVGPVTRKMPLRAAERLLDAGRHGGIELQGIEPARRARAIENADDDALAGVTGNRGDPQVDARLGAAAVDRDPEAAVLRPPAFGNVEFREDLDARHDLAHVAIERLLAQAEIRLAQHAVDAEPDVQRGRQHLQVDVAAAALDRATEHLLEQLVGLPADLVVEEHRRVSRRIRL